MAIEPIESYRKEYRDEPGAFFLNAYSAALALLNAIDKTDSTHFNDLINYLRNEFVSTPLGRIKFDNNGNPIGTGFSLFRVKNGIFKEVE